MDMGSSMAQNTAGFRLGNGQFVNTATMFAPVDVSGYAQAVGTPAAYQHFYQYPAAVGFTADQYFQVRYAWDLHKIFFRTIWHMRPCRAL